jgi:hypothetical protein
VGYFWGWTTRQGTLCGDIMPKRFMLRPDVAFVHSALFMMDAVVLTDSEIHPGDFGTSDRS